MLVDLAHVSPAAIDDVLAMATKPTVVSHGGVAGTCANTRTLTDAQVRGIAAGGGVIGIGYWDTAICGREPRHVVAAMRYVIGLVGDDHVGLGSDYDGATTVGFDTSQLAALTQEMLERRTPGGFDPQDPRRQRRARAARGVARALSAAMRAARAIGRVSSRLRRASRLSRSSRARRAPAASSRCSISRRGRGPGRRPRSTAG